MKPLGSSNYVRKLINDKITSKKFSITLNQNQTKIVKIKVISTWFQTPPTNQAVLPILPNNVIYTSPVLAFSPTAAVEVLPPRTSEHDRGSNPFLILFQRPIKAPQTPPF